MAGSHPSHIQPIAPMGGPLQPAQHPTLTHDSIPPSIKRIGRAVPQAAEGRLAVPGRRRRLARPPPFGDAGHQDLLQGSQRFSPAEAVFGLQLILPGQFINTAESPSPSFLSDLQTTVTNRPPPPTRHNSSPAPSTVHYLKNCCWPASSWSARTVRSRRCRPSTTAPTECWSGQHTSSSSRWGTEPTRCPRSA
jgi:hypothetical protein